MIFNDCPINDCPEWSLNDRKLNNVRKVHSVSAIIRQHCVVDVNSEIQIILGLLILVSEPERCLLQTNFNFYVARSGK